jgi:ADP-ribose pyrophosphatase YjhB (NUDIX family)
MNDFIIRVYALIINDDNEILLTDEFQLNTMMTKFPGGGLEFGEGTADCLKREMAEECNGQKIGNIRHFYTTDFYQKALFYENKQLISIYYLTDLKLPVKFNISKKPFDFDIDKGMNQSFRWKKINALNETDLSFPIDRFVIGKLKELYK